MTKEELLPRINEAINEHYYIRLDSKITLSTFKEMSFSCLTEVPDAKIMDVYCTPKAKMWLMEKFWVDDFNYLGTRIRIISENNLKTEPSTIQGMDERYRFLFIFDGVAYGLIDTVI